jgi:hypothetical protein
MTVTRERLAQPCRRSGRIDDRFRERALSCDREPDDVRFRYRSIGRLLRRAEDEVAYAASLNLSRALDDRENVRRNPRFDAGCAG